jgi:translation initiation factor IF-2
MDDDFMQRGYLLPEGCKDLVDAMRLQAEQNTQPLEPTTQPAQIAGELMVLDSITVRDLAALLNLKPLQIIADLMGLGVFANVNQLLHFDAAAKVVHKHGYLAKRAA